MASAPRATDPADERAADLVLDAVVIGAGVAGLYQLHQLREQGLRVRAYDAADDVGGAWWWHGFPGARVDTEGYVYQYLFSETLYREWSWSERFPAGYEVLRWLHFLADRLDLRRDIQLSTRVLSAHYDADAGRWTIRTDRGESIDAQFVVSCAGTPAPGTEDVPEGHGRFAGRILRTSAWPWKGPDLTGERVGVVGAGAAAVQLIPKIVDRVGHLTVFAGAPTYVLPMRNPAYGWQDRETYKARFRELRDTLPHTFAGFPDDDTHAWAQMSAEERQALLEDLHRDGSLRLWLASSRGAGAVGEVSEAISEFVRDTMRERLADPRLADILVPTDHAFGAHRVALENGYLEVYHRDDVELVGVRDNPIARLRPEGVELADGTVHELDVIVLATGFDAAPGGLTGIDVRGRDGRALAEEWRRDPRTTLGLATHGFPNLLTTAAPLAPSPARYNTTAYLQQQTEWIAEAVRDLRARGRSTIEATPEGEDAWVTHAGGLDAYRQKCDEEAAAGYPSFTRT